MQYNQHVWCDMEDSFSEDGVILTAGETRFADTFLLDKNAKRFRGAGCDGPNYFAHAASALGNSGDGALSIIQNSFRRDMKILLEASTTTSQYLITHDQRFYDTITQPSVWTIFESMAENNLPIELTTADKYIF